MSESARSKLHLLLARRLKSFCDPCEQELATELALHFEGGRDYEQAVNYLLVAADNAVGRFAYRDCMEILQHAHELVLKLTLSKFEPKLRFASLCLWATLISRWVLPGRIPPRSACRRHPAHAERAGPSSRRKRALTCTMYPLGFIGPEEGVAALEEALKISKSVNDPANLAVSSNAGREVSASCVCTPGAERTRNCLSRPLTKRCSVYMLRSWIPISELCMHIF